MSDLPPKAKARLEEMEMAFEEGVPDDARVLYRVVSWSAPDRKGRRLRRTSYYADEKKLKFALSRIDTEDLILCQEFRLITRL